MGNLCFWSKEVAYHIAYGVKEYHYQQGGKEYQMQTGKRGQPHALPVVLSPEVTHPYRYGSAYTVIDHKAKCGYHAHHLMCCQGSLTQPAHHDYTEAEGGSFHAQLQGHGKSEVIQPADACLVYYPGFKSIPEFGKTRMSGKNVYKNKNSCDTAYQGRQTGSG